MATNQWAMRVVNRRIKSYEDEDWKRDYEVATRCWRFEQKLGGFIELFHFICEVNDLWREDVYGGIIEPETELNATVKDVFDKWLAICATIDRHLIFFEGQSFDGGVERAEEYRECVRTARSIRSNWKEPQIATAIGCRHILLDKEQSDWFRRLAGEKR
jgi:hypothetical protein